MRGYSACKAEFENTLRQITMMGYGLILITHAERRVEKDANDDELEFFSPALNKRAYEICNRLVDVIGYINVEWKEDGSSERYLYTRATPRIMAGSRYKYLAPKIKFGYDELVSAVADAIDASAKLDGAKVVDHNERVIIEEINFNDLRKEASELWEQLVKPNSENPDQEMAKTVLKKAEILFGRPIKLSEVTEDQKDIYHLLVMEMRDLAGVN